MATSIIQIKSSPGIKRDGTRFDGDNYIDGQWVRFQRGLPRKIGGYRQISNFAAGIVRQFFTQALNNFIYTHMGYSDGIQLMTIDTVGNTSAPVDRTPAAFIGGDNFTWQLDAVYDGAGAGTALVGVATDTAMDISNGEAYQVYIGDIYGTAALVPIPGILVSGGVCVLHPYLFVYGSNGYVQWSDANDPTNFTTGDSGNAWIDSSKVVKMLPLRGGGQSPAGIIWTLDRVIRVSYTGNADVFAFDTVTASSSVLAANSIIEYDGIYFWIGMDRFLMYNGVVKEVENNMNLNYFFTGLNDEYANKIFAYKVPRFGEIWWCYPRGDATECTHAVIYNFRENSWYDTELPNGGRSAGLYAQVFHSPIMAGVVPYEAVSPNLRITQNGNNRITEDGDLRITDNGLPAYKIWRHEIGVNEIDGTSQNAILSYFETGDISALVSSNPRSVALRCEMIEPDFVQSGELTVQMTGRINARAPEVTGPIHVIPETADEPYQQQVFFKEQRREMRFRFQSNTVGGNYQMGQVLAHIDTADGRYQS
jgi:hypothetical protein